MQQSGKRDVPLHKSAPNPAPDRGSSAAPNRKQIAAAGEQIAAGYLGRLGLNLVCSNWRSGRFGEIDLIFQDSDGLLVFVEVKTRKRHASDGDLDDQAFSAIDWRKRHQLLICARSFLARSRHGHLSARMDAVLVRHTHAVYLENGQVNLQGVTILHVANAFGCP